MIKGSPLLSKSEYMMFLRHPAWLWLKKHDKGKLPEPDASLQALFDAGNKFEKYAESIFSNAKTIGFDSYQQYLEMPKRTQKALDEGVMVLFQGRFEADGLTCICDVVEKVSDAENDKTYDLIEIKASTRVKPEHIYDLAFQVHVLESCGLTVRNVSVVHVNNQYKRSGALEIHKLVVKEDVTKDIEKRRGMTEVRIQEALQVIESKTIPDISPRHTKMGSYRDWLEIYKNLGNEVSEYSVYNLASASANVIGLLEDLSIREMKDIPSDIELGPKQVWQVEAVKSNERIIDKTKVEKFLEKIEYPIYFLDYETMGSVIPPYDGMHPYQQMPFQYSLHILESPDSELIHKEYLHSSDSHPAKPLAQQLKKDFGDKGSVIVWYAGFEKACNKLLGETVPEYAEFLEGVNDRIIDLMIPFSKGWFVDKGFGGSASIKKVLPVLMPSLSHKELEISDGGTAQRVWMQTILGGEDPDKKDKILNDLKEYCRLDTLAMVEIWRVLRESVMKLTLF